MFDAAQAGFEVSTMRTVTLILEMSDDDTIGLLNEASELADSDEVTRMAIALQPSYVSYQAKILGVGAEGPR